MMRDPGPIHNIGFGVTSRDIPVNEGEQEGTAPNSGYISRALDGHPMMKFIAATATTLAVSSVLTGMTKKGGLKLAKFAQDRADSGNVFATSIVESVTSIRRHLDELEGFTRYIEDADGNIIDDGYSRMVYELDGQLTTGYRRGESAAGYGFSADERLAGYGAEVDWAFRDELQQRLVRAGRRLPYELPALYAADKTIVQPLFGERDQEEKKVKWYNPADVVADFVTESAKNIATMVLPFEFAGAASRSAQSSLQTLRHSQYNLEAIQGNFKPKIHRAFVELDGLLSEVGHDVTNIVDKFLRTSAKSSGALSAATEQFRNIKGPVQTFRDLRHGVENARRDAAAAGASKQELRRVTFDTLFGPRGSRLRDAGDPDKTSFLDLIPTVETLRKGFSAGRKEYKTLGLAQDAMGGALAFNRALARGMNSGFFNSEDELLSAVRRVQMGKNSRITQIASTVSRMGRGGPESDSFTKGEFYRERQRSAFSDTIISNLVRKGVDEKQARRFVNQLEIEIPSKDLNPTKLVNIGKRNIHDNDDSTDFFNQILNRYKTITTKDDFSSFVSSLGGEDVAARVLNDQIGSARNTFFSLNFQSTLKQNAEREWQTFYDKILPKAASGILSPRKASFYDFARDADGNISGSQMDYLKRKSAETLGLRIVDDSGERLSSATIDRMLGERGFDPTNFVQLRSFLVRSKKMTSGIGSRDGFNIFGFKQMSVDEARSRGMFDYMRDEDRGTLYGIVNTMKMNDPISYSIGRTKLDGVYTNRSGQVLDFTSIKAGMGRAMDFFASEFKIPILNFNPADLFGYRSIDQMRSRSPIQYISSSSVQPYLPEANNPQTRSDFYMWVKGKGTKGKVYGFKNDSIANETYATELKGLYRSVPTQSSELWSRHSRYGADESGTETIGEGKRFSKLRRFFRVDDEQPNSLFNLASRFRGRKGDLENPNVMASLLRGDSVEMKVGRRKVNARLNTVVENGQVRSMQMVDESGAQIQEITESKILGAFERFGRSTFGTGMPRSVQMELAQDPTTRDLFTYFGRSPAEFRTPEELRDFAYQIINDAPRVRSEIRRQNQDPAFIDRAISRLRNILGEGDLMATSRLAERSPTISTKFDELNDEIFRYITQVNPSLAGRPPIEAYIKIEQALTEMASSGKISPSQLAEARASTLASWFNSTAFRTYSPGSSRSADSRRKMYEMTSALQDNQTASMSNLLDPYIDGSISQISTSVRRKLSPILSPLKKNFGVAPYQIDELATDPLGSGQRSTLVPTFGTVFARNPMRATLNAAGFTTYSDPEYFSGGSIPMSQGVERLNRYFGSIGLQLDVSAFSGPLDLFTRGMVGSRVLPLYAAGVTALTADRILGGYIYNERDDRGERVYTPMVTTAAARTAAEIHSLMAGLMPGGMSYTEKREQLLEGEVPIRKGRFWPLGNTPFMGGNTMYYRPSYYRMLKEAPSFTSDTYGSPMEKFLFYNDISPLRPLDPYRFERKHYNDRPYPVSGDYFTGPFGPLTPILNATVGRVLKPRAMMHEEELQAGLAQYAPAGEFGAFNTAAYGGISGLISNQVGNSSLVGAGLYSGSASSQIGNYNQAMASQAGVLSTASTSVRSSIGNQNQQMSQYGYSAPVMFSAPKATGVMVPNIVPSGEPLSPSNITYQTGDIGYRLQEMAGIYGFAFSSLRQSLGFGQGDFEPQRSVLQPASRAYGSTRSFWDLNLGGLGDIPIGGADVGNLEFSEIVRRFIPKERTNIDYLNPIKNTMGQQYPFLPGPEYYTDFTTGDPFTKVQQGEVRLPGVGYERFNTLYGGSYGPVNQLDILADVAPYSKQFRQLNKMVDRMDLSVAEREKIEEIRRQQEDVTTKFDFSDYVYKNYSAEDLGISRAAHTVGRIGESIAHTDNFLINKTFGKKTAIEDWERNNVYGSTFPQWQRPYESYIEPMLNKATQDNPLTATIGLGAVGALFGRTPKARLFGTAVGATAGLTSSVFGNAYEAVTGDRFIPLERKKELALEEYGDILEYVRSTKLASEAQAAGDYKSAFNFRQAAKRTMYGADIESGDPEQLAFAIPKRKREHFKAMIETQDQGEREKILSTSGRLERRFYQAAWGMRVEEKPDLVEYFSRHELPDENWEGWSAAASSDHTKIKIGQHMGLELSQMGYYPQQIRQANLANMSYPDYNSGEDRQDVLYKLRSLMSSMGLSGSVRGNYSPFTNDSFNISAGVG
jgi:hypothetical protein